jgi:hypothetical protein
MKNVFGISATNCRTNRSRASASLAGVSLAFLCFHWRSQYSRAKIGYEESFQNPVFDPGSRDLHSEFRGRQAELSEDR